jgi:hypothetical protein
MKRFDFYNHSDGSRVRVPAGQIGPPSLHRAVYCAHVETINTSHDLRATLRAGKYTSLGSYPVFYITGDGESMCHDCVHFHYRDVSRAVREHSRNGWRVDACVVNWEETDMQCAHCNQLIPAAYGE